MPGITGDLTLGDIFAVAGVDASNLLALLHTYVHISHDATDEEVMAYTGQQEFQSPKFPAVPPGLWMAATFSSASFKCSG